MNAFPFDIADILTHSFRLFNRIAKFQTWLFSDFLCEKHLLIGSLKAVFLVKEECRHGSLCEQHHSGDAGLRQSGLYFSQKAAAGSLALPFGKNAEFVNPVFRPFAPVFDAPQGNPDQAAALIKPEGQAWSCSGF